MLQELGSLVDCSRLRGWHFWESNPCLVVLAGRSGGFLPKKSMKEVLTVSEIIAPMGGKVLEVKVSVGDTVNDGDEVVILEAMKMELPVVADASGSVKEVRCKKGDAVEAESVMIVLE